MTSRSNSTRTRSTFADCALGTLRRRIDVDAGLEAITRPRRTSARRLPADADPDGPAQPLRRPVVMTTIDEALPRSPPRDQDEASTVAPIATLRIAETLERLDIRYLAGGRRQLVGAVGTACDAAALEGP